MTAQTDRLNTALAGRYTIERELGVRGMATIFLARSLGVASNSRRCTNARVIAMLTSTARRLQVSAGDGANPQWAPSRHEIFYRGERRMMVATLSVTKELTVTRRDSLFELALAVGRGNLIAGPNGKFGVFPDGKSLLMIGSAPSNARVSVILNWQALLAGQGKK